jgi:hypothetical protein
LVVALLGGHVEEDLGWIRFAGLVAFAPDVEDAVRVGHRLDAFDVDGVELIKIAEDVVELCAEFGLLLVAHVEPREVGDVVDVNVWCAHTESDRAERVVKVRVRVRVGAQSA